MQIDRQPSWFKVFSLWGLPYLILPIHWKGCGLYLILLLGFFVWAVACVLVVWDLGFLPRDAMPAVIFLPFLIGYFFFMRLVYRHSEKSD